jgi:hypothetical protein
MIIYLRISRTTSQANIVATYRQHPAGPIAWHLLPFKESTDDLFRLV